MKDKQNNFLFILAQSPLLPQSQGNYPHSVGVSKGATLLIVTQFERQIECFHEGEGLTRAGQKLEEGTMIIRCRRTNFWMSLALPCRCTPSDTAMWLAPFDTCPVHAPNSSDIRPSSVPSKCEGIRSI